MGKAKDANATRQVADLQPRRSHADASSEFEAVQAVVVACLRQVGGTVCKSKTPASMHLGAWRQYLASRAAAQFGGLSCRVQSLRGRSMMGVDCPGRDTIGRRRRT